jgi:hypothetical protein
MFVCLLEPFSSSQSPHFTSFALTRTSFSHPSDLMRLYSPSQPVAPLMVDSVYCDDFIIFNISSHDHHCDEIKKSVKKLFTSAIFVIDSLLKRSINSMAMMRSANEKRDAGSR